MAKPRQRTVICTKQVGCDGATMAPDREMCAQCTKAMNRRGKAFRKKDQPGFSRLAGHPQVT